VRNPFSLCIQTWVPSMQSCAFLVVSGWYSIAIPSYPGMIPLSILRRCAFFGGLSSSPKSVRYSLGGASVMVRKLSLMSPLLTRR
jgi:hypothetical protein